MIHKANNPRLSIIPENFNDRVKPLKAGLNGFYVRENQMETNLAKTLGFDLSESISNAFDTVADALPINITGEELQAKAESLATKTITNYVASTVPQAPVTAKPATVASPQSSQAMNNMAKALGIQDLDPMSQKLIIIGGGLVGTLLVLTIVKTVLR